MFLLMEESRRDLHIHCQWIITHQPEVWIYETPESGWTDDGYGTDGDLPSELEGDELLGSIKLISSAPDDVAWKRPISECPK